MGLVSHSLPFGVLAQVKAFLPFFPSLLLLHFFSPPSQDPIASPINTFYFFLSPLGSPEFKERERERDCFKNAFSYGFIVTALSL